MQVLLEYETKHACKHAYSKHLATSQVCMHTHACTHTHTHITEGHIEELVPLYTHMHTSLTHSYCTLHHTTSHMHAHMHTRTHVVRLATLAHQLLKECSLPVAEPAFWHFTDRSACQKDLFSGSYCLRTTIALFWVSLLSRWARGPTYLAYVHCVHRCPNQWSLLHPYGIEADIWHTETPACTHNTYIHTYVRMYINTIHTLVPRPCLSGNILFAS